MKSNPEQFSCIFCKSFQAHLIYDKCRDYYLQTPYLSNYYQCNVCGLVQQYPIPKDISALYAEYPIHDRKSFFYNLFRKALISCSYYSENHDETRKILLDYGCGDGFFLDTNKNKNYELHGYEPDQRFAKELSQRLSIDVSSSIDELLTKYKGRIDILTMHFVLEHLPNIQEAFEHASELVKQGGSFFFTVPNFMSLERKLFGKKWHSLDPPRHISFPDESIVRKLAEQWGFELIKTKSLAFPNGFAASLTVLLAGRFVRYLFFLLMPIGFLLSRLFPNGSQGYLLIRK